MTKLATFHELERVLSWFEEINFDELDSVEREALEAALKEAIANSVEKRDRIAHVLFDLGQKARVKHAAAEQHLEAAGALQASAKRIENEADRLSRYVLEVMLAMPKPEKGPRRIEGTKATFTAKACPPAVEITDEHLLPPEMRTVTITMPFSIWSAIDRFLSSLDSAEGQEIAHDFDNLHPQFGHVAKNAIRECVQQKGEVTGARLKQNYRLEVG